MDKLPVQTLQWFTLEYKFPLNELWTWACRCLWWGISLVNMLNIHESCFWLLEQGWVHIHTRLEWVEWTHLTEWLVLVQHIPPSTTSMISWCQPQWWPCLWFIQFLRLYLNLLRCQPPLLCHNTNLLCLYINFMIPKKWTGWHKRMIILSIISLNRTKYIFRLNFTLFFVQFAFDHFSFGVPFLL